MKMHHVKQKTSSQDHKIKDNLFRNSKIALKFETYKVHQ